jgi:hypothetical protein
VSGAAALFEAAELPVPPVPAELVAAVRDRGDGTVGTRPPPVALYRLRWYLEEDRPGDYLLMGLGGHGGVTSWCHYYLVRGPLQVFLQLTWQPEVPTGEPAPQRIGRIFHDLSSLLAASDDAVSDGRLPPGAELRVVCSDPVGWVVEVSGLPEPATRTSEPLQDALALLASLRGPTRPDPTSS